MARFFGVPMRNGVALGVASTLPMRGGLPVPALNLDFLSGALDSRITFTRGSTATFFDSTGTLQTAAINAARFDTNPSTLAPLGLLIEEQRTNLLLQSQTFDNASWTKTDGTISADATTAPDGTTSADKFIPNNGISGANVGGQTISFVGGIAYTLSIFAKAAEFTSITVLMTTGTSGFGGGGNAAATFNLANGTVSNVERGGITASIQDVGNGWYRLLLTATPTLAHNFAPQVVRYNSAGDGTSGLFIWGAQLEAGAFPTSYIPTTTTALTRNADVASMTGTNFSSWFNASEGTLFVEASNAQVQASLFSTDDGTASNRIITYFNVANSPAFRVVSGGVDQCNYSAGTITQNAAFKLAAAYQVNDFAASLNGAAVVTDTSGTIPTGQTTARIGTNVSLVNSINGYLRRISYYPRRLPSSTLQALTA